MRKRSRVATCTTGPDVKPSPRRKSARLAPGTAQAEEMSRRIHARMSEVRKEVITPEGAPGHPDGRGPEPVANGWRWSREDRATAFRRQLARRHSGGRPE